MRGAALRPSRAAAAACAAALLIAAIALEGPAWGAAKAPSPGRGVVNVTTNLAYQGSAAAGTGMVLTPTGVVLTNNHVIRGATSIRIVLPSSRKSYTATVLGYSITSDVALLKLQGSSSLPTVRIGNSAKVRIGQPVAAVGNAGGRGTLTTTLGRITGLGRTITAMDEQNGAERLTGLLQTSAVLEPGDSGGPLLDGTGRVIGMDTAGSGNFVFQGGGGDGYAVPINRAMSIVRQIRAGRASATVHVGGTAFLGISAQTTSYPQGDVLAPGAAVVGVVPNSPADRAGIVPGDVITALGGRAVQSPATLVKLLLQESPGESIQLDWLDQSGVAQTANVTLASGPPQ